MSTTEGKKKRKSVAKVEGAPAESLGEAQASGDFAIQPEKIAPSLNTSEWPLLLKNFDKLLVRTGQYTPIASVWDDQPGQASEPIVARGGGVGEEDPEGGEDWAQRNPRPERDRVPDRVPGARNEARQEPAGRWKGVRRHRPPPRGHRERRKTRGCYRAAHRSTLPEAPTDRCGEEAPPRPHHLREQARRVQPGASPRRFLGLLRGRCIHLGLILGVGAHMQELRRVRSGIMTEHDHLCTMHDVLDAQHDYETRKDETYLRRVVKPLELMLIKHKRIVMKDSAVNAVCYGAKVMVPGILRFEAGIEIGEEVVLMTTKGEAIAIAIALMTSSVIATVEYGVAAKLKRVVMDRDTYPRRWGMSPRAQMKKKLIQEGKLGKYGKPLEVTPEEWLKACPELKDPSGAAAASKVTPVKQEEQDDDEDDGNKKRTTTEAAEGKPAAKKTKQ